jgi:hypothetical protein
MDILSDSISSVVAPTYLCRGIFLIDRVAASAEAKLKAAHCDGSRCMRRPASLSYNRTLLLNPQIAHCLCARSNHA